MKQPRFFKLTSLLLSLSPQVLTAADELRGEQQYDIGGNPDPEGSFWDPAFWRDRTEPIESPVIPEWGDYLDFGSKNYLGEPLATRATGMTLKTGAALGFTPPAISPLLADISLIGNVLRFDGTPDLPGPLGQLNTQYLYGFSNSSVDFDRTIVTANNLSMFEVCGIQLTGDVTAAGHAYNMTVSAGTGVERLGERTIPPLLIRNNARAHLAARTNYVYSPIPMMTPSGDAPVFRVESGGHLRLDEGYVYNPTGLVFDANASVAASSILLGNLATAEMPASAQPLTLFRAVGSGTLPATPTIRVTGNIREALGFPGVTGSSRFTIDNVNGFSGRFAHATNHGRIAFEGNVDFSKDNNVLDVLAESGGRVEFSKIRSVVKSFPNPAWSPGSPPEIPSHLPGKGTIQLDWEANTDGMIDGGMATGGFLHLNGAAHSVVATGAGRIQLMPNLGIDSGGTFSLQATGTNSDLSFPHSFALEPWDDGNPATPPGSFASYAIAAGNGTFLTGGSNWFDKRTVRLLGNAMPSTFALRRATASNLDVILGEKVEVTITSAPGAPGGSTLRHVDFNVGSDSTFTVSGGTTWRPLSIDSITARQTLTASGTTGNNTVTLTGAAAVHEVDINIGIGGYASAPLDRMSTLTVGGGATWTGALHAGANPTGNADVSIAGAGTTAGLRFANLGATATPQIGYGPILGPGFSGRFFTNTGGAANLTVSSGARVSIGSYATAFGDWARPSSFSPAWLVANGSTITIDDTSAVFIGDAASPAAVDFRNGGLVVGPGGYLLGSGTVRGSSLVGRNGLLALDGGQISPGFSPGEIEVEGTFLMESGTLILEVGSNLPGGFDQISADQITITGGTIRIVPTAGFIPGPSFSADLFQALALMIGPSVVIEFDPAFAGSAFDRLTGLVTVASITDDGDANDNGIPDILEEVLPPSGDRVEMPTLTRNPGGASVFGFRRLDSSENNRPLTVQWSTDLEDWNDIPVPATSAGNIIIEENGSNPDQITVILPDPAGAPKFFARLKVE